MLESKSGTHTVFKNLDANKYLNQEERYILGILLNKIEAGRKLDGKYSNSYLICNEDEPYADDVKTVILVGEENKIAIPPIYKKVNGKYEPKPLLPYEDYAQR